MFRIAVVDIDGTPVEGTVVVSIGPARLRPFGHPNGHDHRLPELAPSTDLRAQYDSGCCDWHEFARRFSCQLRHHADACERLRTIATDSGLTLLCASLERDVGIEHALAEHLRLLECEHRWDRGLMIGGFLFPVRDEVIKAGGLYFARHKAWMMPNREAWRFIQSLLPGDF